jgi:hypothetical protein
MSEKVLETNRLLKIILLLTTKNQQIKIKWLMHLYLWMAWRAEGWSVVDSWLRVWGTEASWGVGSWLRLREWWVIRERRVIRMND